MLVICPIFDRIELLPFYLTYYTRLGATQFVMALWNGRDNLLYELVQAYAGQYPIELRTSITCPVSKYNGPDESNGLNQILDEFRGKHEWYCVADLDEFYWFDGGRIFRQVIETCAQNCHLAVHGTFCDRFARGYSYPPIMQGQSLDATFPLICDVTRCHGGNDNKITLCHSSIKIESGHHYTSTKQIGWNMTEVHHFKWTEGILDRLRERDAFFHQQGMLWAGESKRFIGALEMAAYMEDPNYRTREARSLGV